MTYRHHRPRNWGLLASLAVGAVVLPILFGGLMIGGGGCEGRAPPCIADHSAAWIIMGSAAAALVALGWAINRALAAWRRRR